MERIVLRFRVVVEGILGFNILLFLPFFAIGLLQSRAPTRFLLGALLGCCILFLLGILLFRDAVILAMRLKKQASR
jgi:hypothetical protein